MLEALHPHLPHILQERFASLTSPFAGQQYLNSMPYATEERDRAPQNMMRNNRCDCLDNIFSLLWPCASSPT